MRETLINNFLRISEIPRKSGCEEKIADFFVSVAKNNNLYYFKDENNNVLIRKKGSINSVPIALQAHLDMVCVKRRGSNHDFSCNGIRVIIVGDKVTAKDTSLGADQGVGLAIMLTLMEDNTLKHPDLEFLLTVEEETTFKGAVTFPYSLVESKRLINLDNSKDNTVITESDGDILNRYTFIEKQIRVDLPSYRISIDGFPGGNSGDNIELSETNAITTMAKILHGKDILLKSINGGNFENDLASSCEVVISTTLDVEEMFKDFNSKIEKIDNKFCFSSEDTENIIDEILGLKCGYISDNNVSGNIGIIETKANVINIYYIIRCIDEKKLENISNKSKKLHNHFIVAEIYRDSAWRKIKKSELLNRYKSVYFNEYNEYPKEEIGHGGTECSAIKKRIDGLDIISIGANMEKFHTTEEVTYIDSWVKVYNLLVKLLDVL